MHGLSPAPVPTLGDDRPRGAAHRRTTDPLLDGLLSRHSVGPRWMVEPGPSMAQLELAVRAALRAPDHGKLVPWRAAVIGARERAALGELFARIARESATSADEVEAERGRAARGPVLVAWIARPVADIDEVPLHEQWMCVGGALTNFLNALHLMGFAAKTLSGRKCRHPALREAFCSEGEVLAAFVAIGTPTRKPAPRGPDDAQAVLSSWRVS